MKIQRAVSRCFSLLLLGLAAARNGLALDPNKRLTQYRHNSWKVQDGMLPDGPEWVTQTADGYLLMGSRVMGVYQFDGVRFLPSPAPASVLHRLSQINARGGGFWVSEARGVTHFLGSRVISYFDLHGTSYKMIEDVDGSVWAVLTSSLGAEGPLCHVTDASVRCFGKADGISFPRADAILPDGQGGSWIGTSTALVHWKAGHATTYESKALRANVGQAGILNLALNPDGSLWVGTVGLGDGLGLEIFTGDHFESFRAGNFDGSKVGVSALLKDRDENLWIGSRTGVYRIHGESVDHYGTAEGLSSDAVLALFEDKEGIVWVSTTNGLDSFRDRNILTFSHAEGLSRDDVFSVLASRDGTIWAGNVESLDYLKKGMMMVPLRRGEGLAGNQVASLLEDRKGQIWAGVDDGLFLYENRHFLRLPEPKGRPLGLVVGITEDVDGNIWAECASNPRKLVRIRDFRVQEEFLDAQVPAGHSIAADPKGGIWLVANRGDLMRLRNGTLEKFPLEIKGDFARQVEAEPDGSVLVAAPNDGLIGLRMGKVQRLTKSNGLPCDGVYGFIQDKEKNWWLETPCGYVSVADTEMQRWWIHPDTRVQYRLFDIADGARTRSVSFNPSAKSPDGRLWFATGLLQSIDPRHLLFNTVPPPVQIERLTADHKAYEIDPGNGKIRLPPLSRDLEIDYTALSLMAPEKNRFRVKLEGWDRDWKDAGNERKAFYGNLPPRDYRFRVAASNNDGVWNEAGAFLDFSIDPAYYQTRWFQAACGAAFLALLWALYRYRLHQVAREFNVRLEERVGERTRLARDLHDTLLQGFQGLMLRLQAIDESLPEGEIKDELERTLDRGDQVVAESRKAVHDLRSSSVLTNDLAQAVRAVGNELSGEGSVTFGLVVEGETRELHPIVRDEIYRITREALRNAFSHARARRIEAEIIYGEQLFRLRIRDDGEGIAPDLLEKGRPGHYGLPGMRERAAEIGAKLDIWSGAGTGTEIDLSIPGSIAYGKRRND